MSVAEIEIRRPRSYLSIYDVPPFDPLVRALPVTELLAALTGRAVLLTVDTLGGQTDAGALLYAALLDYRECGGVVVAHVPEVAASAAARLLLAADYVVVSPGACVLLHGSVDMADGRPRSSEASVEEMLAICEGRTFLARDDLERWLRLEPPRGARLDAETCVRYGWADEVGGLERAREVARRLAKGSMSLDTPRARALAALGEPPGYREALAGLRSRAARLAASLAEEPLLSLTADSFATTDYTYSGTQNTATEVATQGARMRNNSAPGSLPAILASGAGVKVGSYTLGEPVLAALTALARTGMTANDVCWYRGNINRNKRAGAPLLVDPPWTRSTAYVVGDMVTADPVTAGTYPMNTNRDGSAGAAQNWYYCTVAGTSAATGTGPTGLGSDIVDGTCHWSRNGSIANGERLTVVTHRTLSTATWGTYRFDFTLQPRHLMDDNFDALRYLGISAFSSAKAASGDWPDFYVPIADRSYKWSGTPGNAVNASKVSAVYASKAAWYYGTDPFPFNGYLRVVLYNVYGSSDARDYDFSGATAEPATANAGGWTLGGSSPPAGGGGDNGGGACPAPDVGVLLADGTYCAAGLLRVGDRVWTVGEDDGPGEHQITAAQLVSGAERLVLALDDDARLVYSPRHLVMTPSGWCSVKNLRHGDRILAVHGARRVASVLPVAAGPVVRISTTGRTYVTEGGVLNHNLKPY